MTIEQQALALVKQRHKDEAAKDVGFDDWADAHELPQPISLRRAILAHAQTLANFEAFRQDVSAVAKGLLNWPPGKDDAILLSRLFRFIIAPPVDPLAQTISDEFGTDVDPAIASRFRAALAKHGLQITGVET